VSATPMTRYVIDQCTGLFQNESGKAEVHINGVDARSFSGSCYAYDSCTGSSVTASAGSTGLYAETYIYHGDETGKVRVQANTTISGEVNLSSSDSAAAAVGYASFECDFGSCIAVVGNSAAETKKGALGSISFQLPVPGKPKLGFTVTASTGTGVYSDADTNHLSKESEAVFFSYKKRGRAELSAFANGAFLLIANCTGSLEGSVSSGIVLFEVQTE